MEESKAAQGRSKLYDDYEVGEVGQSSQYGDHAQTTLRNFSVLSLLGMGFALTNSWWAISASMIVGLPSGGTVGIVYGLIILFLASLCVGATLSELASAWPDAGGQYFWTIKLASPQSRRFQAYVCGYLGWFGAIFTSVSVAIAVAAGIVGMVQFNNPDLVIERWMVFVTSQLVNLIVALFNIYSKILPTIGKVALLITLTGFIVTFVTVLASSSGHFNSAHFVFAEFVNETGWSSNGIAFIVGLINPSWAFPCLDAATHLAEEVPRPERAIPIAIMGTVLIGFVTSFSYVVGMFFAVQNLDLVTTSATGVPILELFSQAISNKGAVIFLEVLVTLSGIGTLVSSQTWQSRLAWSFSRDQGIWGSRYWAQIHPRLMVPINAHVLSVAVSSVLLCLYMASLTAFNSMVSACVVFLYLSYLVPTANLLIRGRASVPRGPFWLGSWGVVANYGTILWSLFTLVFFSFPFVVPVNAGNMNYLSAVLGVFLLYIIVYWFLRGRKRFALIFEDRNNSSG